MDFAEDSRNGKQLKMVEKSMEDEMTDEEEEAEEDKLEEQQEKIREIAKEAEEGEYGYPPEVEKPSAFAFFRKVVEAEDTSKTSFLRKEELGGTRLSVRDYQTLANFQYHLGHEKIARYLAAKAEITLRTGLSNEGFLMNLAVTQRKERLRRREKEGKKIWQKE